MAWEKGVLYRYMGISASNCKTTGLMVLNYCQFVFLRKSYIYVFFLVERLASVLASFGQGSVQLLPLGGVGDAGLLHFVKGGFQAGDFQLG